MVGCGIGRVEERRLLICEDCMRGGMLKGSGVRENAAVIAIKPCKGLEIGIMI